MLCQTVAEAISIVDGEHSLLTIRKNPVTATERNEVRGMRQSPSKTQKQGAKVASVYAIVRMRKPHSLCKRREDSCVIGYIG